MREMSSKERQVPSEKLFAGNDLLPLATDSPGLGKIFLKNGPR